MMPTRPTNPTPKNLRAVAAAGLRTMAATCKNSCREPARIVDANQTYPRVTPVGTRVPRWRCPRAGATISLLPAFLAAKWSGTLERVEEAVATVESVGMGAAVELLRPSTAADAIGLAGAWRWTRRRVVAVHAVLLALVTLLPDVLEGVAPTVLAVRAHLGTTQVLRHVRSLLGKRHEAVVVPVGFLARARR